MPALVKTWTVVAALSAAVFGYVDQWHSFTHTEKVSSLIVHQGQIYAGTQGGIRRIDPSSLQQRAYSNLDGLLDCEIVGLAETGEGTLWAVSRSGLVYALAGNRWTAFGRSFASEKWTMNDRAVLGAGNHLFLGSEKGLAIFDIASGVSQANLTQFSDQVGISVFSVLRRGDTVYIGTSRGVFKTSVDFSNPVNPKPPYGNLFDPENWKKVSFPLDTVGAPERQYNVLVFFGDSLATYGLGTVITGPIPVEALFRQTFRVGNTVFPLASAHQSAAVIVGDQVFVGGLAGVIQCRNPLGNLALAHVPQVSAFPPDTMVNIVAVGNQIWGQSYFGLNRLESADKGFYFQTTGIYPSEELITRGLKNLSADPNGDIYAGSWGAGLVRVNGGGVRFWNHKTDPCILEVSTPDGPLANYIVLHALSNVHQGRLFFSAFKAEGQDTHQLVFLNTSTGKISCVDDNAGGGSPHILRIFSESLLGIGSERGVDFFNLREGVNAPVLTPLGQYKLPGQANETWDLALDPFGRPWALIGNQLAYAESVEGEGAKRPDSTKRFKALEGFAGNKCHVLKTDPLGMFWIGCENGLFHAQPAPDGLQKVRRFGLDDGLLSATIRDLSVNPANGQVWIATDRGVNMLESRSQPPVSGISSVRVFPNPFQARHRFVFFDNLPRNSTVRIHTPDGNVIRTFRPSDLAGNQAQWDGRNDGGRAVAPGIYLYSVAAGSSVTRGKLIVAR